MAKQRYRLNVNLGYQTDPAIVRRHAKGDVRPEDMERLSERVAGEVVDDIPAHSLPWLLEQELVEAVEGADGKEV